MLVKISLTNLNLYYQNFKFILKFENTNFIYFDGFLSLNFIIKIKVYLSKNFQNSNPY